MKKVISIILFSLIISSSIFLHAQWEQTSRPGGGNITAFAVIGTHLFAGTHGGGVFLSSNNARSWIEVNLELKNLWVNCLAISGTNLFAGTGKGVFLSTNLGKKWKAVNSGLKKHVNCLAVSGTTLFAGTDKGVFISMNNGKRWKKVDSKRFNCLAVSGMILLAGYNFFERTPISYGTWDSYSYSGVSLRNLKNVNSGLPAYTSVECLLKSGKNFFAGTDKGIFLSEYYYERWIAVNSGLPKEIDVQCLAVSGMNLLAGTEKGVFLSTNNGRSWTAVNSGLPAKTSVYCLAVCGTNLFASTEDSKVWRMPLSGLSIDK